MAVDTSTSATVALLPSQLMMKEKLDMAIFYIEGWKLDFKTQGGEGLQVSITMRRKITSELMTTYFPSLLLTAITFATTFFKPFFFEAALSVNLTTMLVMTTIFISKMEGLPPTSDIKMIDIWLILCQMVPFAEVILLTAMEYNREDKKKGKKKKSAKKTKKGKNASMMVIPVNEEIVSNEQERGGFCLNCRIPSLKTLGENICTHFITVRKPCVVHTPFIVFFVVTVKSSVRFLSGRGRGVRKFLCKATFVFNGELNMFLAESKALPLIVVTSFIVYSAIALSFYY